MVDTEEVVGIFGRGDVVAGNLANGKARTLQNLRVPMLQPRE